MRRLLVTGGAGFIGANFVRHWLKVNPGQRLVVLDALTYAGNYSNLRPFESNGSFRFVQGDIRDGALVESLLQDEKLDTIVHFAAESHVDRSISGPDAFIETNVLGTHSLLKAARKCWLGATPVNHRFHHVSTDEVYGSLSPTDEPFRETTPYAPNSPYAASKAASDHLVRAYHHTYGLSTTISNCSNNYGEMHFPEKLIPLTIVNILRGLPIPVYGDGRNVRDWLHVEDHCRAIARILEQGKPGEVYNVGGRAERENIFIVKLLCDLADELFAGDPAFSKQYPDAPAARGQKSAGLIKFVSDRPGHDRRYAIDCAKLERELGFVPTTTFDEGIRRTLAWFATNRPWWTEVMDGSYRQWIETNYRLNR